MSDIERWLAELNLAQHAQAFRDADIDIDVLPSLTADDLRELKLSIGHRRKILAAIDAMRHTDSAPEATSAPVANQRARPDAPQAEHRQLTVMFCDLVGSTALSTQLDPEDYREVILGFQECCVGIIKRFDGFIARYLGDGMLVYFGYPHAHEASAERAVRAGLGIVEAVVALAAGPVGRLGLHLAVRVGIATGPVVVGDLIGEGASQESAVHGETPNLAARLQGLAGPNCVVIAPATRQVLGGLFVYADLGSHQLKGFTTPVTPARVLHEGTGESRFDAAHTRQIAPVVGRAEEVDLLLRRWRQVVRGEGQVIVVTGEAGIGKSRISQALRERLQDERHTVMHYQCSPFHTNSALHPIISHLERAAGFTRDDTDPHKLDKLETLLAQAGSNVSSVAPLIAELLSIPVGQRYPPLSLSPQLLKDRTLTSLVEQLRGLALQQPVLFMFEDLQWIDPTSKELLDRTVQQLGTLPVMALMTSRQEFRSTWTDAPNVTTINLHKLSRETCEVLIGNVTGGKPLPAEVARQIADKTDGVPLFVEELTKTVLESGLLRETDECYVLDGPLPPLAIPATLQDSLMARLDRLASVKEIAQIGAVIGREFSHELLQAAADVSELELDQAIERLTTMELIFRRGTPPAASYTFKHALVQDTAYASLLKSRRQQLHARIAQMLAARFADVVETQPEIAARHFSEAGLVEQAVPYWLAATRLALARSANDEATGHAAAGLRVLASAPQSQWRNVQELELLALQGAGYRIARGYASPEVEATFNRAMTIAEAVGDLDNYVDAARGLLGAYYVGGRFAEAKTLVEQVLGKPLAPHQLAPMRYIQGSIYTWQGRPVEAREAIEASLANYDAGTLLGLSRQMDTGVLCASYQGLLLSVLGYPQQALAAGERAIQRAESLQQPVSLGQAHVFAVTTRTVLGLDASRDIEIVFRIGDEHKITYIVTIAEVFQGIHLVRRGEVADGVALTMRAIERCRGFNARVGIPTWMTYLADACVQAGDCGPLPELHAATAQAMAETGERYPEAELHRVQGEWLLHSSTPDPDRAEACLQRALNVARHQQARWFELRAAASLARLWSSQERHRQARALLDPIYTWFGEGLDLPELEQARVLLAELG